MRSTKPFFLALESILKNRLPADAFAQVMEESLWEFESGPACEPGGESLALARLGSVSLAFYRAMTRMGIPRETAMETLKQAGERLGWSSVPGPVGTSGECALASYFRAKNALPLCHAVFCDSCPERQKGCTAGTGTADWVPAPESRPASAAQPRLRV
jgi:hypothetical protein